MNAAPRIAQRSMRASASPWACFFCKNALPRPRPHPRPRPQQARLSFGRNASTSSPKGNQQRRDFTPTMDQIRAHYRQKNRSVAYYTLSTILGFVALTYCSVPFYKMICQTIGWGGQPVRANDDPDIARRLVPVKDAKRIKVTFNASTSDVLPWKFSPQQREVRVLPGETALAFYTATNTSDTDIIGVATYSVTPAQCAPYFSKIQCFCFEEQRLNAGETVDMPVFFYLDPDLLNDLNMKGVETVTLSYTFFSEFFRVARKTIDVANNNQKRGMTTMDVSKDRLHRKWLDSNK
ncbi:Cytochrome c oxidase assembly protein cox11, mitochondrial [Neonectria punicea]|uniref:Cytochrome c oxidase assembly protein cox11, mitochondrial n=1 Tax=Neonectria punicea TaxID=979145 RepID=A0ABR1GS82_9HYPO